MTIRRNTQNGFTMVEIAFSLAIVAFALVAIMGVLPTGMTVQKDNREDTLINNDAAFWVEALRSGSRGIDDLTNYVEDITIEGGKQKRTYVALWSTTASPDKLQNTEQIIGLLSTPKYVNDKGSIITNVVTARVRAINGPAIDMRNPRTNEFAFRYQLESEVTPVYPAPVDAKDKADPYKYWAEYNDPNSVGRANIPYHLTVATNLHNLRLTLRWPVFEQGNGWGVGRNRRTVRALANGQVTATLRDEIEGHNAYPTVRPNTYQYPRNATQP